MKNLSKLYFISFVAIFLSLFITSVVSAEVTTTSTKTPPAKSIILADVNIRNAKIVSQEGNTLNISFLLTNGEGLQTGIKYGLALIKIDPKTKSQTVVDEKIYDESITLNANTSLEKSISYVAPSYLDGEYILMISSKNSNNFPFAFAGLGKVTLSATTKGIEIIPSTCFLQVVGEKDSPKYNIGQGIDIKPEESLTLTCSVSNPSDSSVSVTPSYETHLVSSFGDIVKDSGGDNSSISIGIGEKKDFTITLPKALNPQAYMISFSLGNKEVKSNPISINYLIRGSNATIKSISLDKDYYKKGDSALVFFTYFPSIDSYTKGRYDPSGPTHIFSKVEIKNSLGLSCAKTETKDLKDQVSTKVEFPMTIKSSCFNPKITVTLTDENGKVLDQKEYSIQTTSVEKPKQALIYNIIIILILLALALYFYSKKKNSKTPSNPTTPSDSNNTNSISLGILFFLMLGVFSLMPTNVVKATTEDISGRLPNLKTGGTYCIPSGYYAFASTLGTLDSNNCYTLGQDIPTWVTYGLNGEHYDRYNNTTYSYRNGGLELYGALSCGDGWSYCYGYGLKADTTDNYNKRQIGGEGGGTYSIYNWFNYGSPVSLSGENHDFPSSFSRTIPLVGDISLSSDESISFSWYISHFDMTLLKEIFDYTVGSDTLSMVYPQPMVDVTTVYGSIQKGSTDTIQWRPYGYPDWASIADPISCECHTGTAETGPLCYDVNGNILSGTLGGDFKVAPTVKTTYYITCKDSQP